MIELGHEGVEEPHGIVRAAVVVEDVGQEDRLGAVNAGEVGHGAELRAGERRPPGGRTAHSERVFTQAPPEAVRALPSLSDDQAQPDDARDGLAELAAALQLVRGR